MVPPEYPGVVVLFLGPVMVGIHDYVYGGYVEVPFNPPPDMDTGSAILELIDTILNDPRAFEEEDCDLR